MPLPIRNARNSCFFQTFSFFVFLCARKLRTYFRSILRLMEMDWVSASTVLLVILIAYLASKLSKRKKYPPGPKGRFSFIHIFFMQKNHQIFFPLIRIDSKIFRNNPETNFLQINLDFLDQIFVNCRELR
jgi:hypothetical protein